MQNQMKQMVVIESTAILTNFYIHPDIQYIINPSGIDQNLPNSLAGIIRIGAQL